MTTVDITAIYHCIIAYYFTDGTVLSIAMSVSVCLSAHISQKHTHVLILRDFLYTVEDAMFY